VLSLGISKMPISLAAEYSDGLCPLHMRRSAEKACEWYSHQVHEKHLLQVVLVNAPLIIIEGEDSHGSFWYEEDSIDRELFVIQIAANMDGMGESRQKCINLMLETLFHEFVHYEQARDGKKVWERGVDDRAKKMLEEFTEDDD